MGIDLDVARSQLWLHEVSPVLGYMNPVMGVNSEYQIFIGNECWFLDRVVQVREKYNLSIDQREADAIDAVLDGCSSVALVYTDRPTPTPSL